MKVIQTWILSNARPSDKRMDTYFMLYKTEGAQYYFTLNQAFGQHVTVIERISEAEALEMLLQYGEPEKSGAKCTKPNCDCLEKEEKKQGGMVKNYPCLAAEKDIEKEKEITRPSTDHICQLLRDCLRTFNNLNIDSGTIVDRIKSTIKMYSDWEDKEHLKLVQSKSEDLAWEDIREAMYNASKKNKK